MRWIAPYFGLKRPSTNSVRRRELVRDQLRPRLQAGDPDRQAFPVTAPNKLTITPERIAWFADYYRRHPAWGVFHVSLYDGNWTQAAIWDPVLRDRHDWPTALRDAADWFDRLSASQRRRLKQKAEDAANTIQRA